MAKTCSWWKLMKARKQCGLRAAGDYLLHSLLVGPIIGMKFIYQSDSMSFASLMKFSFEEKHLICFRVLHMFFKRPGFAMTIYNLPRKFECFLVQPPYRPSPVQQLHQEDLNLPTFVKIGEPTDEDSFLQSGNTWKMIANIMVIDV